MTFSQFEELANNGVIVECKTVLQRRNVLELFQEMGFEAGAASKAHLVLDVEEDKDTRFMHPGVNANSRRVSCYRKFDEARSTIGHGVYYQDIANLAENPRLLDDRSDEEFLKDFALLIQ